MQEQAGSGAAAPPDEAALLRRCLGDLVSLLALPALCSGRDEATVLDIVTQTLERLLSIDLCCARTSSAAGAREATRLRVRGRCIAPETPGWEPLLSAPLETLGSDIQTTLENTPIGPLRIARVIVTYSGAVGVITAGSASGDFPDPLQSVLLRSAVSLIGNAVSSARLLQEREAALRAKDEFLAMLGHELRNPLAPIVTALEIARLRAGELSPDLQIIQRQVKHLTSLVDDLLDVARVTGGKIELNSAVVEIAAVIANAIDMARPLIEQRRHLLQVQVPATGLAVHVDARRMAQVISNLLINAAKYTEPAGRIAIRAQQEGETVCVAVQDSGVGISAELLGRVFDMFEQGHGGGRHSKGGLGVGLAIARSIVQLHGGSITASSPGINQGSEFTVRLPMASLVFLPSGGVPQSERPLPNVTSQRVLIVDDNEDAAVMIAALLSAAGHEVRTAHDGPGALQLYKSWPPSVVVLDIGLPVMDGYQLAGAIRAQAGVGEMPRLIALTGYGREPDKLRSVAAGISVHLVKPVAREALLSAIAHTLPATAVAAAP